MNWRVRIEVLLKESILDPQGQAVKGGLTALGYKNVSDVKVGKYLVLNVQGVEDRAGVEKQVEEMCESLLANPVIEDYKFQLEKVEG